MTAAHGAAAPADSGRSLRFQAFVFNWPGEKQRARALEVHLAPHCPVVVVNSDDARRGEFPHWVHVGADAYFTRQWDEAVRRFEGDALLHVQADAWIDDVPALLRGAEDAIARGAGVYAPDVDYTTHTYDRSRLVELAPGLCAVPNTDCTCWVIHADVVRATPQVDPVRNRLGWGIDYLVAATALRLGRAVVRDYRLQASHPRGTGYDVRRAREELRALLRSLPRETARDVDALRRRRRDLRSR